MDPTLNMNSDVNVPVALNFVGASRIPTSTDQHAVCWSAKCDKMQLQTLQTHPNEVPKIVDTFADQTNRLEV